MNFTIINCLIADAATNETWFPFGTPGGGAPNKKPASGMLSKSVSSGSLIQNGSGSNNNIENEHNHHYVSLFSFVSSIC